MLIKIYIICLVLFVGNLFCQEKSTNYPIEVPGGSTIKLPDTQNTFWIMKNSQYIRSLKIAGRQEIDSIEISLLIKKLELYDLLKAEKDTIVNFFKDGYVHYRDLWEDTSKKLEDAEIRASKRWLFFESGLILGALAIIIVNAFN